MQITLILSFFTLGLIFGSFYNVVGIRLPQNIPFANDRSRCPGCGSQLHWKDNIPFLSYLHLRGKCRYCQMPISPLYPVMELTTGLLFAVSFLRYGFQVELLVSLLLVSMLVIIFVADIRYMLIPNKVLLFFLPIFVAMRFIAPLDPWWYPAVGLLIGYGIIFLVILVSGGGMGAGDMKLFAVLGVVLGMEKVLLAFFLSCLIGTVAGILLLSFRIIKRKQPVPFGPYIAVGSILAYYFGDSLISNYINLL